MSYTFGAATTNAITFTLSNGLIGDNRQVLVAGWWYPTTLTATRAYWGAGATIGAEVDTTTSEIRLRTDNTTDGQWVTSGAGITTNKWHFLAFLNAAENTTVAGAWRVWVGDENTAPVIQTPSVSVSRSGNYTSSNAFAVGNKSGGSAAFQGDIGWVSIIWSENPGINTPLYVGTSGVIADAEATLVEERWILPLWRGTPDPTRYVPGLMNAAYLFAHFGLDLQPVFVTQLVNGNPASAAATVNGATWSENQPPVRLPRDWITRAPFVPGA